MEMNPEFDPAESVESIGPDDCSPDLYLGHDGASEGRPANPPDLLFAVATADEMIELPERGGKVISWLPTRTSPSETPTTTCRSPRGFRSPSARIRDGLPFLPKVNPTWFFAVPDLRS